MSARPWMRTAGLTFKGAQAVLASPRTVLFAVNWGTSLENASTFCG
ncbi:MAG: hypothetical protein PWQ88_636, partial [Candidatus Methanomethylophilaceae archaeon]|nr:hypothetical protein [Candidatus Methanomethylophilaceae archaeon]